MQREKQEKTKSNKKLWLSLFHKTGNVFFLLKKKYALYLQQHHKNRIFKIKNVKIPVQIRLTLSIKYRVRNKTQAGVRQPGPRPSLATTSVLPGSASCLSASQRKPTRICNYFIYLVLPQHQPMRHKLRRAGSCRPCAHFDAQCLTFLVSTKHSSFKFLCSPIYLFFIFCCI